MFYDSAFLLDNTHHWVLLFFFKSLKKYKYLLFNINSGEVVGKRTSELLNVGSFL